jgi:hypothetical protein
MYMKSIHIVFILIFVLALSGYLWTRSFEKGGAPEPIACTMDAKICPDGTTVGRTGPTCEFTPCPEVVTDPVRDDVGEHIQAKANLIVMDAPLRNSTITSPLTITGKARGTWFFEASFPISIVNWDGLIIGEGIAQAQSDWMTEDFVPFKATITYTLPKDTPYLRGAIILKKDNPSGLPEHDDALEVPIMFGTSGATTPPSAGTNIAPTPAPLPTGDEGNMVVCTMDAKICPDGTAVGRSGPKCEFAPCP